MTAVSFAGYVRKDDRNIVEDEDDAVPSGNQLAPAGASASRASAARWPSWVKKSKATSSLLDVEKLSNARPVAWGEERPDQLLVFPLSKNTPSLPAPASTGSGSRPSSDWRMKQVGSGSHIAGLDAGSNAGVDQGRLVYEDVYKYPPQGSGAPPGHGSLYQKPGGHDTVSHGYRPADTGLPPQPVEMGRPFRTVSSQSGYRPHEESFPWQEKVNYQLLLQKPQDGAARHPAPLLPRRIVQSSNSFQRYRQTYKMSKYDPNVNVRKPEGASGVGPAVQPADPEYFMRPPWYGHPRCMNLINIQVSNHPCLLGSRCKQHGWFQCHKFVASGPTKANV